MIQGKKEKAEFYVGLDFGTSTIKCVLLSITGPKRRRARHVLNVDGQALFPSSVWEMPEGFLFFGQEPKESIQTYRSIKSFLVRAAFHEADPRITGALDESKAEVLTWALLTYVTTKIVDEIRQLYPESRYQYDRLRDVFWNMGVPLDGVQEASYRLRFLRILYAATQTEGSLLWTKHLEALARIYKEKMEALNVHCQEVGGFACAENAFIISEAHVAVNAFLALEKGNVDRGLYFVCDVGAGTTDFAFFRYAPSVERPIIFYSSASTRTGGDDCALFEAELIRNKSPEIPWSEAIKMGRDKVHNRPARFIPYDKVYKKIKESRFEGFRRAFKKEQKLERWFEGLEKEGGGAVFGGGSWINGIKKACLAPIPIWQGDQAIHPEKVSLKKKLPMGMSELHRIAYGLSIPAWEFFEGWPPDSVSDFKPPAPPMYNHDRNPYGSPYEW